MTIGPVGRSPRMMRPRERETCKGKKGDKGDDKGGKKATLEGCATKTKDGKTICFEFNNRDRSCKMGKECRLAHVCGKFKKEKKPMYECTACN